MLAIRRETGVGYHLFPELHFGLIKGNLRILAKSRQGQCLDRLEKLINENSGLKNQIILLKSRLNSEEKSKHQGIVSDEQYNISLNQITNALLELINELAESDLKNYQILNTVIFPKKQQNLVEQLEGKDHFMPVELVGKKGVKEKFFGIYNEIKSPFLKIEDDSNSESEFILELLADKLIIKKRETGAIVHGIEGFNYATVEYIKSKLETIEKWQRVSDLTNATSLNSEEVDFQFHKEESDDKFEKFTGTELEFEYGSDEKNSSPNPIWYQIKAKNKLPQDLYFSLFHLSQDFGISNYFPCEKITANSDRITLDDEHGLVIESSEANSVTDTFLLIVSSGAFDDSKLLEEGLKIGEVVKLPEANRAIQSRGIYTIQQEESEHDWFTKKITVTLKRLENLDQSTLDR